MRFTESFLEQLRAALSVADVVARHHTLRKAGAAEFRAVDDESLSVNTAKNVWRDFGKGDKGGDIFAFEMFRTGCTFQEAVERMADLAHIPIPGQKPNGSAARKPQAAAQRAPAKRHDVEITATYDYTDADGALIYQVCRQEWVEAGKRKKTFLQRRPFGSVKSDHTQQNWIWGLGGGVYLRGRNGDYYIANDERLATWADAPRIDVEPCAHMLYHLPELHEELLQPESDRREVFICEGEKDCDTLHGWGCIATTNSGGAKNWRGDHAEQLRGASVIVLLDNDQAGRERGHAIAQSLRYIAARVRVLDWQMQWLGCPDKADVTDWRDQAQGTADRFFEIVDKLRDWSPEAPASAFGAVRFTDIDKPARELQWTIKNVLQRATVSLWYGAPSSGKSFLLTDASMAVARGTPWMGFKTRPGLVIYQTGEGGIGFRQRLKAYRQHERLQPGDDVPFVYLPSRINLFEAEGDVQKLIGEIKAWASFYDYPLELVVIDTFNAASGGANENANQDVGRVLERCRRIVNETGAHVAVVHHSPAAGGKPRGHSSLVGDVETTVAVEQTEQFQDEERADGTAIKRVVRLWTLSKQKDGPSSFNRSFVLKALKVGTDEDGDEITSCIVSSLSSAAETVAKGSVPRGYAQLNSANEDIFRSLLRAVRKSGRMPPLDIKAPPGTQAVTVGEWQAELLELSVGHEDVTETLKNKIKMRIYRASKAWLPDKTNLVVKEKEWIWRTQRRVHGIDAAPLQHVPPSEPEPLTAPGETVGDLLSMGNSTEH